MPLSTYSSDPVYSEKKAALSTSPTLMNAGISSFIGFVFLVMSFSSPYWLQSWADTQSPFKNMGLWEFCFDNYRFPYFQFDKLWHGCHATYGDEFRLIREWMSPWWLIIVQMFSIVAFVVATIGQLLMVALILRIPLAWILQFEVQLVRGNFLCNCIAAIFLFLCVTIFGGCCWNRDWLMYPNYNYPSWSYGLACFSILIHCWAAYLMFLEGKLAKEKKDQNKALVMQMYPTERGSIHTYHGSQYI